MRARARRSTASVRAHRGRQCSNVTGMPCASSTAANWRWRAWNGRKRAFQRVASPSSSPAKALLPGAGRAARSALRPRVTHQRFRRRIEPCSSSGASSAVSISGHSGSRPGMFVLHRHHRGEVVQGEVARVLDPRAEALLRQQRGVGRGHAAVQQHFLEAALQRLHRVRRAAQQERQHAQRAAGKSGIGGATAAAPRPRDRHRRR